MIFYDRTHLLKQSGCRVSDMLPDLYVITPHGTNEIGLLLQASHRPTLPLTFTDLSSHGGRHQAADTSDCLR